MFVNGIESVIPSMSVSYGEDNEIFVREGTQMDVEKFTLSDFNEKLIEIFDTADSMRKSIMSETILTPKACGVL